LAARGYATGGFVAGPWLKRLFGLAAGFEHWDDEGIEELNGRRAEGVTQAALRWLETIEGRPFLLFLNYYDPHSPYDPPEGWRDAFLAAPPPSGAATTLEQAVALYDGEIRYVDHQLGIVLDRLRQLDAYDDAWIIVTADHGELLGEHGKTGHGRFLYEEEIRIPLIVKPPKGTADYAQARIDTPASLVDIVPMLARALDLEEPPAARASALALGRGAGRRVLAELEPEPHLRVRGNWKALIDGPFKLIWNDAGHTRLHDLRRSGAEDVNLSGREASRLGQLEAELETLLSSLPPPLRARAAGSSAGEVVDEATRRALEGLGYLERDE
jgi:arylsulfatase A-like enzyme